MFYIFWWTIIKQISAHTRHLSYLWDRCSYLISEPLFASIRDYEEEIRKEDEYIDEIDKVRRQEYTDIQRRIRAEFFDVCYLEEFGSIDIESHEYADLINRWESFKTFGGARWGWVFRERYDRYERLPWEKLNFYREKYPGSHPEFPDYKGSNLPLRFRWGKKTKQFIILFFCLIFCVSLVEILRV